MSNLFRHLTDYARSHLTFSGLAKNLKEFSGVFKRDCFVAALLAMTLFSPRLTLSAFSADDEMTVSVPEYIRLENDTQSQGVGTGGLSRILSVIDENTLKMDISFHISYKFTTNTNYRIYITIKAPVSGGEYVNAWKPGHLRTDIPVAFTKNDNSATAGAVSDVLSNSPSPQNNLNVIAFVGHINIINGTVQEVSFDSESFCLETITQEGRFWFAPGYNGDKKSVPGTFSPHDSAGVYTATVTVTTIAP